MEEAALADARFLHRLHGCASSPYTTPHAPTAGRGRAEVEVEDEARLRRVRTTHCNTTSLVNQLVTMLLTGYQLVEVYQLKAGQMSRTSLVTRLVTSW